MKAMYSLIPMLAISVAFYSGKPEVKHNSADKAIKQVNKTQSATFSYLRAHRQGKGISLTWAALVSGPVTFSVEKTYSDPSDPYSMWDCVSELPGNGARSYKCSDNYVFPGYSNYRVVALADDGSVLASSETVTVRIVGH